MKSLSEIHSRVGKGSTRLAMSVLGFGLLMGSSLAVQAADKAAKAAVAPAKVAVIKPIKKYAATAECVRAGERVIAALARDDSGAANQFYTFYNAFKCSQPHLAEAFGCLVKLQVATPGLSNPSSEQVDQCWNDPTTPPVAQASPPAAAKPDAVNEKK